MSQLFNAMNTRPANGQHIVLQLVTGDIVAPVQYKLDGDKFKSIDGNIRNSAIKGWADVATIQSALNIQKPTDEELEQIEKEALHSLKKEVDMAIRGHIADLLRDAKTGSKVHKELFEIIATIITGSSAHQKV
ncbi:hypothetical protein [Acinetobacter sp. A47]|uniref:hypothetical protein n=1 Tax=Acinetobacter sp. A47 TaxID=1561217 RepID=UPI00056F0E82|nr:hypothetical protein [Acinetobacter sp. A47]